MFVEGSVVTCTSVRLRAISYFSLKSYCTRYLSKRAAINEGVSRRRKSLVLISYCNITSWFAIALAEIRTGRILREKLTASSLYKRIRKGPICNDNLITSVIKALYF